MVSVYYLNTFQGCKQVEEGRVVRRLKEVGHAVYHGALKGVGEIIGLTEGASRAFLMDFRELHLRCMESEAISGSFGFI